MAGGVTLYTDIDNSDAINKVIADNTLQMLRNRMISGRYNVGVNPYIRKVSFVGDQLKTYEANAQNLVMIGDRSEDADKRRNPTKYIFICCTGGILIFAIAFMGKRAPNENDPK